jgi:hypothetical protein
MFELIDDDTPQPTPAPPGTTAPGLTDTRLAEIRDNNAGRRRLKAACPILVPGEELECHLDRVDRHGRRARLYTSNTFPNPTTAWILHARTDPVEDEVADLLAEVDRLRRLEAAGAGLAEIIRGRWSFSIEATEKLAAALAAWDAARGGGGAGKEGDRG